MEVGPLGGRAIHLFSKIEGATAEQNSHPSSVIFQDHCTESEAGIEKAGAIGAKHIFQVCKYI